MNSDTRKHALLGISGVSLAAALGWTLVIKPMIQKTAELEETVRSHEALIGQHAAFTSASSERPFAQVREILGDASAIIESAVLLEDVGTTLHDSLNALAASEGVLVTRIEATGSHEYFEPIEGRDTGVSARSHSVRIECEGTYAQAVRFIDSVQGKDPVVRCRTFRIVPVSGDLVQLSLELDAYALSNVPGISTSGEPGVDPQIQNAGVGVSP